MLNKHDLKKIERDTYHQFIDRFMFRRVDSLICKVEDMRKSRYPMDDAVALIMCELSYLSEMKRRIIEEREKEG